MNLPPLTPRNILIAVTIAFAIYFIILMLPGGPLHPAARYNCADHGYIACCFSGY